MTRRGSLAGLLLVVSAVGCALPDYRFDRLPDGGLARGAAAPDAARETAVDAPQDAPLADGSDARAAADARAVDADAPPDAPETPDALTADADAPFAEGSDAAHDVATDAPTDPSAADVTDVVDVAAPCPGATCDGRCVDTNTDPAHCGGCRIACPGAVGGRATCTAGACGLECSTGTYRCDATCGPGCDFVSPPRPVAPLSTATVTSQQPELRWELASDTVGARVELCAQRDCARIEQSFDVAGTHATVPTALAAGVWFWRVRGLSARGAGNRTSPVWQFTVGARSAPVATSFGSTLDVNGDGYVDLAVGASGAMGYTGRVHVYLGGATGLATTPSISLTGPDGAGWAFGYSVASAGDVNGDGYADLAVGARRRGSLMGSAHVYFGGAAGLATTPSISLTDPDGLDGAFGVSVASAGDVNGDGYADLAVGALQAMRNTGRVHVYLGGATGLATTPSISLTGPDGGGGFFGVSVASAGDINSDGYADLAVGAHGAISATGRVHVYLGRATGLATTPGISFTGPEGPNCYFGESVASAGDVNGDGYADLAVSAEVGSSGTGRVHVYLGGAAGLATTPSIGLTGPDGPDGSFSRSVVSADDINGDGYADLAVGTWTTGEYEYTGAVDVYLGGAAGPTITPSLSLAGPDGAGGAFGYSVASAGDVNGDGYADLAVSARQAMSGTGHVHVYLGGAAGLAATPAVSLTGPDGAGGYFGESVASAGDVNSDGYAGLTVGAPDARGTGRAVDVDMRYGS